MQREIIQQLIRGLMNILFIDYDGISTNVIAGIIVAVLTATVSAISIMIKKNKEKKKWQEEEIRRILNPIGSRLLEPIKSKTFIPTMGQMDRSLESEESKERFELANYILKQVLDKKNLSKKRYAILGGSGTGKSTFIASFVYLFYKKFSKENIPFQIKVISLKNENCLIELEELSKLAEPEKLILVLEGLDENIDAQKNVIGFMETINKATSNIMHVIITCRTHLFLDSASLPGTIIGQSDGIEPLGYTHVYISPFVDSEIQEYLGKKYLIGTKEYQKAITVTNKCKGLLSRAMILYFIDDLLDLDVRGEIASFEVYKCIVDRWLCRELGIKCIEENTNGVQKLYDFSKDIALRMYQNMMSERRIQYISKDEYQNFLKEKKYDIDPYSYSVRSLIERRNDGSVVFAHRNFWDFFMAIIIMERPGLQINPMSFEYTKTFAIEIHKQYLNGNPYEYINYYKMPFENGSCVYDELPRILTDGLKKLKETDDSSYRKKLFFNIINTYWINFIYKTFSQYSFSNVLALSTNTDSGWRQTILKEMFSTYLAMAQKYFFVDCETIVYEDFIQNILHNELKYDKFNTTPQVGRYPTTKVLYPWSYPNDILDLKLDKIAIGYSISNKDEVNKVVCKILNNGNITHLFILVEFNSVDLMVHYIASLCSEINATGIENFRSKNIIFCINSTFYYVVNFRTINFKEEQIAKCLIRMGM